MIAATAPERHQRRRPSRAGSTIDAWRHGGRAPVLGRVAARWSRHRPPSRRAPGRQKRQQRQHRDDGDVLRQQDREGRAPATRSASGPSRSGSAARWRSRTARRSCRWRAPAAQLSPNAIARRHHGPGGDQDLQPARGRSAGAACSRARAARARARSGTASSRRRIPRSAGCRRSRVTSRGPAR